jgi:hypothetical protein
VGKVNSKELHNLYCSPNVVRMIKSRRMRWAGHVACMEEMRNACNVLVGKPERKRPLERPWRVVDRSIILKWILGKYDWRVWTEFTWLRIGTVGRLL